MEKDNFYARHIPMREEASAYIDNVPVVARSPSYQQPLEEALEQTQEALSQRTIHNGSE